ncbi:MAG: hypothetical protein HKN87_08480 [Saprospiraceae bacterium]|nr:hypothetical protein [Saprospiraceae bacterium]
MMKLAGILYVALLVVVVPSCKVSFSPKNMQRVLVAVEKGTSSVGFYTPQGVRVKSLKVDTFPHEMVFYPNQQFAYVTNNGSLRYRDQVEGGHSISIIDLIKMEVIDEISVLPYKRPHGISLDPLTRMMAVSVENPDKVLLIDPKEKVIVKEFDNFGDTPHMIRLGPGALKLFVANVLSNDLIITDVNTGDYTRIPVGQAPQGMDFDPSRNMLFVACSNYTSVIDVEKKQEIFQIALGGNRLKLSKNKDLLYISSSREGIGFVDARTFEVIHHLDLGYKLFSLNISSDGKYIYAAAEPQNLVFTVSTENMQVVKTFRTPEGTRPDPVKDFWTKEIISDHQSNTSVTTLPSFQRTVVDSSFRKGYQVKAADINGDGLPDIIPVSSLHPEIYWYENPTWKKHLISNQTSKNIDLAPQDIDADGDIDMALACRFDLQNSSKGGYLYWLENQEAGTSWKLHYIDSFPTSHRIRWADVDADNKQELINLPIIGIHSESPEYSVGVEFMYYRLPPNPTADPWTKQLIDTALHMAHGLQMVRWDNDLAWDGLTASFEGVQLFKSSPNDAASWNRVQLGEGEVAPRPKQGSSEVGLGFLADGHRPFVATIEPWHGNKVVVYYPESEGELWSRHVIDTTFHDGHALLCADLNLDGTDEIVAGHRGAGYNLYIYQFDPSSSKWQRFDLDKGGISAAGLCLLDFNQDGLLDIVAAGSATNNIILYENLGLK